MRTMPGGGTLNNPSGFDCWDMDCNTNVTGIASGSYRGIDYTGKPQICQYGQETVCNDKFDNDFDDNDGIQEDSTERNPKTTYTEKKNYKITLTVTDSQDRTGSDTFTITIKKTYAFFTNN
jgi:hypothetical protein